jgi:glycosyltransferase involved in cell wall biosynthesis
MTGTLGIYIPAYNAAPFLDRSVGSVLNQTRQDFEVLILDDASTDDTPSVVQKYLSDPRVRYVRHEKNMGMSPNWNTGLELLTNPFIAKLDADDWIEPTYVETMLPKLENDPSVGYALCDVRWVSHGGKRNVRVQAYTTDWTMDGLLYRSNLLRGFFGNGCTSIARREVHDKVGYFIPGMRIHSDWEMTLRIASHFRVSYTNQPLMSAWRHDQGVTGNSRRDTRSSDDLTLWLDLLDAGKLPYTLNTEERRVLESSMIQNTVALVRSAISGGSVVTAQAGIRFLLRCRALPIYEKVRYTLVLRTLHPDRTPGRVTHLLMRNKYLFESLWSAEQVCRLRYPAADPVAALA